MMNAYTLGTVMPRRTIRVPALVVAVVLSAMMTTAATAAEQAGAAATETLYFGEECTDLGGGLCSPSPFFLGLEPGTASSQSLASTTPYGEALYRIEGKPRWRDYDSTGQELRWGDYPLRSDEPITMAVRIFAKNVGFAVNTTVHGRATVGVTHWDAETGERERQLVPLGEAQKVITLMPGGSETVVFEFDVPDSLEGVRAWGFSAEVGVHGINAESGFIDGQGGSTLSIPYYDDAITEG